jgi:hypothetical protein
LTLLGFLFPQKTSGEPARPRGNSSLFFYSKYYMTFKSN